MLKTEWAVVRCILYDETVRPALKCPEAVFKENYGVWDPMPEFTIITLSHRQVSQLHSQLSTPPPRPLLQREKDGVEEISPIR
jgi:hypothetical protein